MEFHTSKGDFVVEWISVSFVDAHGSCVPNRRSEGGSESEGDAQDKAESSKKADLGKVCLVFGATRKCIYCAPRTVAILSIASRDARHVPYGTALHQPNGGAPGIPWWHKTIALPTYRKQLGNMSPLMLHTNSCPLSSVSFFCVGKYYATSNGFSKTHRCNVSSKRDNSNEYFLSCVKEVFGGVKTYF